jgi:adenylyltransferase/sulfurtransferase
MAGRPEPHVPAVSSADLRRQAACANAGVEAREEEDPGMEITVEQLKARLDAGDSVHLLDVREPHETLICNLPNSTLIPMREIPRRLDELEHDRDIVVYCRSGARSLHVVGFLRRQGYDRAVNLRGGMLAWIDRIDPTQPKY